MAISKVILNGTTLMDVTEDSVTEQTLLQDETATRRDGVKIVGTMSRGVDVEVDPVFSSSAAATISAADISAWNSKSDFSGSYNDLTDKPSIPTVPSNISSFTNDIGYVTSSGAAAAAPVQSVNNLTGNVSIAIPSVASDVGAVAVPASASADEVLAYNGTNWVAGKRMVILSYGKSTWNDFINAYNAQAVVYCRASSNSNPASGAQTRMAFMAYVNNETNPTNVEFQYYRSVNAHSATQQGDQMYVYKIDSTGTWTVTVRESYTKIAAGTGLSSSYNNGTLTLSNSQTVPSAATNTPEDLGTAAVGTSAKYALEDHVHNMPSASDVGAITQTDLTSATEYKSGDTVSFTNAILNGFITSSSKRLTLGLVIPKRTSNITGITVTVMTGELRSVQGYLNSQSGAVDCVQTYTTYVQTFSENQVYIRVDNDVAFTNIPNNNTLASFIGNITLSFT